MNGLDLVKLATNRKLPIYLNLLTEEQKATVLEKTQYSEEYLKWVDDLEMARAHLESVEYPDVDPQYYALLGL